MDYVNTKEIWDLASDASSVCRGSWIRTPCVVATEGCRRACLGDLDTQIGSGSHACHQSRPGGSTFNFIPNLW